MRIAITARGEQMQSPVDPRFGRAKWFVVIDTETGAFEAVDNKKNFDAAQGAGIQAGRNVAELRVEAVITGNVGPKSLRHPQGGRDRCLHRRRGDRAGGIGSVRRGHSGIGAGGEC